jgi:glycosyltransferase involved in cell wall biosynthesis
VVADCLRRLGIDGPYLLLVGAHDPRKDAALLLRVHLRLLPAFPHQLVLVGERHPNLGPVALPPSPAVIAPGRVDDADLVALLTGAAALAFPSRAEGFGLPPLEAVACGTPAVVSDLPVLRESAGGSATFVPPGDAEAWTDALAAALRGDLAPGVPPVRSAADAARELTAVLRGLA